MKIEIKAMYCGKEERMVDAKGKVYCSSYQKRPLVDGCYLINKDGFKLDNQSDRENHGGEEKAICVYALKNYEYLEKKYAYNLPACAFGENFTINDTEDSQICLGDRFACGEVIFEVSQPRQLCWKIFSIVGIKNLTAKVVQEYKTGFYLRVLKSGKIHTQDKLELLSRKYPEFTIEFINKIAFNTKDYQAELRD